MYLIFDTETTGLPKNWNAPISDSDCLAVARRDGESHRASGLLDQARWV